MMTGVDLTCCLSDFLSLCQNCSNGEMSTNEEIKTLVYLYIQPVTSLQDTGHSLDGCYISSSLANYEVKLKNKLMLKSCYSILIDSYSSNLTLFLSRQTNVLELPDK